MADRPRMTMLVDGGVVGDSRVQKAALAAAAAGYDVTLVGRAPSGVADTFSIGPVPVIRVAAPYTLLAAERRRPRGRWRFPLAYRSADDVTLRKRLLDVRWTDYQAEVQLTKDQLSATPSKAGQAVLRGRLISRRGRWLADSYLHRGRSLQFRAAVGCVKEPHGPVESAALALARTALREGAWRRLDPVLWDLEIAFGPVIDGLRPDVIHAHDFRMSGVAVRAAARARAKGRRVPVIYDVHEYVPGVHARSARWRAANTAYEREYIRHVDAVVTVSPTLADMLQRDYGLAERPTVVLNAPPLQPILHGPRAGRELPDIRRRCGLDADTPLLVYSGSGSKTRGLATMVEALPRLPDVHVAIVVGARNAPVVELEDRAAALGVRDRFHVLRYVQQELVPTFLASATAGVIPILHFPNHEIALITKYFEYVHARLPIVVSDVKTMAERTRELGNGVVFTAGDVDDFARAVRELLADHDRFAKVYADAPELLAEYSWERQADILRALWQRVTGLAPEPRAEAADAAERPGPVLQLRADPDRVATAEAWAAALTTADPDARVDLAGPDDEPGAATHVVLLGRRWLQTDAGALAELLLAREQRGERLLVFVPADPAYDVPALRRHLAWLGLRVLTTDPAVAAALPSATLVPEPTDAAAAQSGARALLDFLRG